MADALFDDAPFRMPTTTPAGERPKVSPGVRQTQRQAEAIAHNAHPLTAALGYTVRLHPDAPRDPSDRTAPGPRCGTCWYRQVLGYRTRSYPKCLHPGDRGADTYERLGPPRVTHGTGTDVRKWWPGCQDYSPGDPSLSADAARYVPEEVTAGA